jgi:hypothetical protein
VQEDLRGTAGEKKRGQTNRQDSAMYARHDSQHDSWNHEWRRINTNKGMIESAFPSEGWKRTGDGSCNWRNIVRA